MPPRESSSRLLHHHRHRLDGGARQSQSGTIHAGVDAEWIQVSKPRLRLGDDARRAAPVPVLVRVVSVGSDLGGRPRQSDAYAPKAKGGAAAVEVEEAAVSLAVGGSRKVAAKKQGLVVTVEAEAGAREARRSREQKQREQAAFGPQGQGGALSPPAHWQAEGGERRKREKTRSAEAERGEFEASPSRAQARGGASEPEQRRGLGGAGGSQLPEGAPADSEAGLSQPLRSSEGQPGRVQRGGSLSGGRRRLRLRQRDGEAGLLGPSPSLSPSLSLSASGADASRSPLTSALRLPHRHGRTAPSVAVTHWPPASALQPAASARPGPAIRATAGEHASASLHAAARTSAVAPGPAAASESNARSRRPATSGHAAPRLDCDLFHASPMRPPAQRDIVMVPETALVPRVCDWHAPRQAHTKQTAQATPPASSATSIAMPALPVAMPHPPEPEPEPARLDSTRGAASSGVSSGLKVKFADDEPSPSPWASGDSESESPSRAPLARRSRTVGPGPAAAELPRTHHDARHDAREPPMRVHFASRASMSLSAGSSKLRRTGGGASYSSDQRAPATGSDEEGNEGRVSRRPLDKTLDKKFSFIANAPWGTHAAYPSAYASKATYPPHADCAPGSSSGGPSASSRGVTEAGTCHQGPGAGPDVVQVSSGRRQKSPRDGSEDWGGWAGSQGPITHHHDLKPPAIGLFSPREEF